MAIKMAMAAFFLPDLVRLLKQSAILLDCTRKDAKSQVTVAYEGRALE